MSSRIPDTSFRRSSGFSLVEIMVGVVIGMIGVIVMMQIFALSEERKRATTSGGDTQTNGAIALNGLQRDISQAGYGLSTTNLFACNLTLPSGKTISLAPVTINPPVALVPAGDPGTDTLLVVYGNSNGQPQGNAISTQSGAVYTVQMPGSFAANDYVIAAPAACGSTNLVLDKIAEAPTATTVKVASGGASGTTLYNLGQGPAVLVYAIRGGNLTVCNYLANDCSKVANALPVANNIVSLKAQYGRDTTDTITPRMDGIVDIYDGATPDVATLPAAVTPACGWSRISAVRVALVARAGEYDKNGGQTVTNAAPAWVGSVADNPLGSAANLIDVSKNPDGSANPDWMQYRYKVFQTVAPIRNVVWMKAPTGC